MAMPGVHMVLPFLILCRKRGVFFEGWVKMRRTYALDKVTRLDSRPLFFPVIFLPEGYSSEGCNGEFTRLARLAS